MKMMLSKGYDEKKVKFPCYVSQKYDGVPVIFWKEDGLLKMSSRQGKPILSIDHIYDEVSAYLETQYSSDNSIMLVGELIIPGLPFKDISGKVRKGLPCTDLELKIFYSNDEFNTSSITRLDYDHLEMVQQIPMMDFEHLNSKLETFPEEWEGLMITHGEYESGKRSWNSMKFKREPTVDLKVAGVEEAHSKEGEPKGMIGAFICEYKGRNIKVGAGKTSHAERVELWTNPPLYGERIIEVKYMKDDSYEDLRQPTFQQWRDDKNANDVSYE